MRLAQLELNLLKCSTYVRPRLRGILYNKFYCFSSNCYRISFRGVEAWRRHPAGKNASWFWSQSSTCIAYGEFLQKILFQSENQRDVKKKWISSKKITTFTTCAYA